MTLTRKVRTRLEYALRNAERAAAMLARPDVAVGYTGRPATTTLHYTRADGATFYAINKEIGSDLTGLLNAMQELRTILADDTAARVARTFARADFSAG